MKIFKVNNAERIIRKNLISREQLPKSSNKAVLPGSSMGPTLPPNDDRYVKATGSSIDDPLIDQIKYVGSKAVDAGEEIVDAVKASAKSLWEHLGEMLEDL